MATEEVSGSAEWRKCPNTCCPGFYTFRSFPATWDFLQPHPLWMPGVFLGSSSTSFLFYITFFSLLDSSPPTQPLKLPTKGHHFLFFLCWCLFLTKLSNCCKAQWTAACQASVSLSSGVCSSSWPLSPVMLSNHPIFAASSFALNLFFLYVNVLAVSVFYSWFPYYDLEVFSFMLRRFLGQKKGVFFRMKNYVTALESWRDCRISARFFKMCCPSVSVFSFEFFVSRCFFQSRYMYQ